MPHDKLQVITPPAEQPSGYLLDEQVGFLMRVAVQRHTSIFTSRMVEGLTQTQFAALAKLFEVGPCSQNHLGRLIYLDAATIKGVVDRLVKRGAVQVDRNPTDARLIIVSLTPAGRDLADRSLSPARAVTEATLTPLSAGDRRTLLALLRRLT